MTLHSAALLDSLSALVFLSLQSWVSCGQGGFYFCLSLVDAVSTCPVAGPCSMALSGSDGSNLVLFLL